MTPARAARPAEDVAREWLNNTHDFEDIAGLAALLTAHAAEARQLALEEAASMCRAGRRGERECMSCAAAIRALVSP